MLLILTIEAQNADENGLAEILRETEKALSFVTDSTQNLREKNNYGTEFKEIAIIPSCMNDKFWSILGWRERKKIWGKKGEADIRLRIDYERFVKETTENKRLLFIENIIKSIEIVSEYSKGDFESDKLITDILRALKVSKEDLNKLNDA